MEPHGMTSRHPQQAGYGLLRDVDEASRRTHSAAFVQVVDDIGGFVFSDLRIE
jgi:hypothetical protein